MEETADKPKWLLELENRKRKPHLAHEAGAGAACLICNAACPGLDLHFWRKICKNCKCSRDDHDVNDDDFPQFDLLFGPTGKFKKKAILLQVPNKKQQEAETAFEWVPPDTTKELATDYMNALPKDKLPIKGSAGAALRRQLLQKQLPLHDIDQKACNNLSDEEKKQFGKYLENLKKCVGQGKVTKILGARPFNRALMTPANATDMHRSSPQQKSISTPVTHLRTPSSFTPKISQTLHSKIPYNSDNEQNTNNHENTVHMTNTQNPECHNGILNAIPNSSVVANSEQLQQGTYPNPQYSSVIDPARKPNQFSTNYDQAGRNAGNYQANSLTHPNDLQSENTASINYPVVRTVPHSQVACSEKCSCQVPSESAMLNTKGGTCLSCANNCNATQFSSSNTNTPQDVRGQHYKDSLTGPLSSLVHSENLNSDDALAAEAMLANALLPPSAIHSNDIIGSTLDEKGLTYIREKLSNKYSMQENQVPSVANPSEAESLLKKRTVPTKQGNDVSNDKETQRENIITAMKNPSGFSTIMRDKLPQMCVTESEVKPMTPNKPLYGLSKGDHCHSEENGNLGQVVHAIPSTIEPTGSYQSNGATPISNTVQVPSTCGQSDTIHNQDNQNIQCSLPKTDTPAHLMNTNCLQSELNTSGPIQSNVIHSESLQNQVFPHEAVGTASLVTQPPSNLNSMMEGLNISPKKVQKCHECQGEIRVGDVAVIAEKAKNEAWHPGCFACSVCNELLVDLVYFYYKGKLYCGRDLATFLGIPRCFACDELIFVREYTVAEGHNYHVEHFCCWDCDVPLAGQKYISENDRPLCLVCYQKTYAETCNACNVVIAADQQGVAIKNLNFHATEECFCCVICKKNLLNSRMAVKEGKLFCSKECILTFGNQNMSST